MPPIVRGESRLTVTAPPTTFWKVATLPEPSAIAAFSQFVGSLQMLSKSFVQVPSAAGERTALESNKTQASSRPTGDVKRSMVDLVCIGKSRLGVNRFVKKEFS